MASGTNISRTFSSYMPRDMVSWCCRTTRKNVSTVRVVAANDSASSHWSFALECRCHRCSTVRNSTTCTSRKTRRERIQRLCSVALRSLAKNCAPLYSLKQKTDSLPEPVKPKFHLARHVTSRHVRRVERVETNVSSVSSRAVPVWRTTNKL